MGKKLIFIFICTNLPPCLTHVFQSAKHVLHIYPTRCSWIDRILEEFQLRVVLHWVLLELSKLECKCIHTRELFIHKFFQIWSMHGFWHCCSIKQNLLEKSRLLIGYSSTSHFHFHSFHLQNLNIYLLCSFIVFIKCSCWIRTLKNQ